MVVLAVASCVYCLADEDLADRPSRRTVRKERVDTAQVVRRRGTSQDADVGGSGLRRTGSHLVGYS